MTRPLRPAPSGRSNPIPRTVSMAAATPASDTEPAPTVRTDISCALTRIAGNSASARANVESFLTLFSSRAGGSGPRRIVRVQFADHASTLDGVLDELELLGAVRAGAG